MQERRTAVICSTTVLRLLYSGIRLVIIIIVVVVVVIIIITESLFIYNEDKRVKNYSQIKKGLN